MTKNELLSLIKTADISYYKNSVSIMSDAEYDKLRDEFISLYGEEELNFVSGSIDTKRFEQLDFKGEKIKSLDKIKKDDENIVEKLNAILDKYEDFVIQYKIDGITKIPI